MHMLDTLGGGGKGGGAARREYDPEPCQAKPNSDPNHPSSIDAAPNGIQFCAKSAEKGNHNPNPVRSTNIRNRAPASMVIPKKLHKVKKA